MGRHRPRRARGLGQGLRHGRDARHAALCFHRAQPAPRLAHRLGIQPARHPLVREGRVRRRRAGAAMPEPGWAAVGRALHGDFERRNDMMAIAHELKASYAFIERNFNIVKRYWAWELVWLVYTVANSLAVSYIGLGVEQLGGKGVDGKFLVLYLAVGTVVWRYLSVIFYWVTDVVGLERWEGTIEYTLLAPITRFTHMAGQTAFAVVYSMAHTGVVLVATVLLFNLSLRAANLWGF